MTQINPQEATQYRVRYAYENPSNAGPFKGRAIVAEKMAKGDYYRAPFGAAVIVSCSRIKG